MVGNNDNINTMNVTPTPITTAAQPAHEHRQTQNTRANKTKLKKQRQDRKKNLIFVIHNLILALQKAQHDKQTQEDSLLDAQKQIN